jgi:hypothetical protein
MRITIDSSARPLEPLVGWGLACGSLGLLGAAAVFPFSTLPKLCAFLLLTDLPCLTCGMTRSWVALVHGDVAQALAWNPLGALLCVLTALGSVYAIARQLGAPALQLEWSRGERRGALVALIFVTAVNWTFVALSGRV